MFNQVLNTIPKACPSKELGATELKHKERKKRMNMKNFLKGAFAVAALAGAQVFAQEAAPEVKEEKICGLIPDSISLSMQYKSRYISDGFVINPDSMLFGSFD